MRRALLPLAAALLLPGCLGGPDAESRGLAALEECRLAPTAQHVLHFGPGGTLANGTPPAGAEPGNSFAGGFLTNDLREWLSEPVPVGLWLAGNVTLEYWVRSTGAPAPLAIGGEPGEGYHFFNQFGSDRTLQPAYAVEYSDLAPQAGRVDHYTEVLAMPPGGFVVEQGDRLRVLLTDLALDGPGGGGHDVLYGGATPSQVRFEARCWADVRWEPIGQQEWHVMLPANQGLLTGAIPAGQANQQSFQVDVPPQAERMTVTLRQVDDLNPVKDDVDLVLLDAAGRPAWSIGSPYSDEAGTLWLDNLRAAFPGGALTLQVNSYSGVAYTGLLAVAFDSARAP